MAIVIIAHPHGHRPIIEPAIPFAIIVFLVVAPAALDVKPQILRKPALIANLHRLVDSPIAFVLKVGHRGNIRVRKPNPTEQHYQ